MFFLQDQFTCLIENSLSNEESNLIIKSRSRNVLGPMLKGKMFVRTKYLHMMIDLSFGERITDNQT